MPLTTDHPNEFYVIELVRPDGAVWWAGVRHGSVAWVDELSAATHYANSAQAFKALQADEFTRNSQDPVTGMEYAPPMIGTGAYISLRSAYDAIALKIVRYVRSVVHEQLEPVLPAVLAVPLPATPDLVA